MHSSIYKPCEDSFLISKILKKEIPKILKENPKLKFLEIGSGSGANLKIALNLKIKKQNIFSCDINKYAVEHCKNLGFNCTFSNLFQKIPKQKFDIIIFNPPYLSEDKNEPKESKQATTGGKKGNELTIKFLKQTKDYLKKNGVIFLITSSLAKKIDFKQLGYKEKEIGNEKLFFEKLTLWEIKTELI